MCTHSEHRSVQGSSATGVLHRVPNSLSFYYQHLLVASERIDTTWASTGSWFEPSWQLPKLGPELDEFFSVSAISAGELGEYRGRRLHFLNLTENPGTRTTKTFGSSVIVARAVRHTELTGEPVLLVTPSAANKAVALRNAVLRAYEVGLSDPSRLRVVTVVPASSLPKLWASGLDADPALHAANPMGVYSGPEREHVKKITTAAIDDLVANDPVLRGFRVWYTLNPKNYMVADFIRTLFEYECFPPVGERWHTHAVSSAYGFLGHDLGRQMAAEDGVRFDVPQRYLLVQHLETPDLVSAVTGIDIETVVRDLYRAAGDGLLTRPADADSRLPEYCYSPGERLERTFYTRNPPTTKAVRRLVADHGGDGIVVSLPECVNRYAFVRDLLRGADFHRLPEDPRQLREWAMVMSAVGCLNAIDRDVIPAGADVVIHGSGAYSEGEFDQIDRSRLIEVNTPDEVRALIGGAIQADGEGG
ncbi:DUF6002 family protein [Streptomyces sp. NPDC020298]|uniref:DUF6002 family protein n=1 Tax=unclassified Streptomyces TaxID=2593676 RepID=UPI0033E15F7C